MPMDKDEAKQRIGSVGGMSQLYRERARALIDDPDLLVQGGGICGMTSVVRSLLYYDLDKFLELVKSVFDGTPFPWQGGAITIERKHYGGRELTVLVGGRLKQIRERERRTRGWIYNESQVFDFIINRALGKFLKQTNSSLYSTQLRISEILVEHYLERDVTLRASYAKVAYQKEGDLALNRDGLTWILTQLVGARDVGTVVSDGRYAVELVNRTFEKGYRNPFAYGWILDAKQFMAAKNLARQGRSAPSFQVFNDPNANIRDLSRKIEAEHIVVFTGPIRQQGGDYIVSIWTWSVAFEITVPVARFQDFFPMVVFGYFHW